MEEKKKEKKKCDKCGKIMDHELSEDDSWIDICGDGFEAYLCYSCAGKLYNSCCAWIDEK